MFRVTFMVDDSKLGRAMRALVGIAAEQPQFQPASNAHAQNGKVRQRIEGTSGTELVKAQILKAGLSKISTGDLRLMVTQLGYSPKTLNTILYNGLLKDKFLGHSRIKGVYEVKAQ